MIGGREGLGATDRPKDEKLAAGRAEDRKGKDRRRGREFPPETLNAFKPLLAKVCEEAQTGGGDTEGLFLQSLEVEMDYKKAAYLCKRHGFGAREVAAALIEPTVLQQTAFGDLSPGAVKGLKSALYGRIAPFFAPANKKCSVIK